MIQQAANENGFSAVELLVTLFIAAAFIVTGYQLYSIVVKDGGEARSRAIASNLAYETLRTASVVSPEPACSTTSIAPTVTYPIGTKLDEPKMTVQYSAPKGCSGGVWVDKVMKTEVTVEYGPNDNRQKAIHAIYTAK